MARPKRYKAQPLAYHCGLCGQTFKTRAELSAHTANHADSVPAALSCPVCTWEFSDSLALEQHLMQTGHGSPEFECDTCGKHFISKQGLEHHYKPPSNCLKTPTTPSAALSVQYYKAQVAMAIHCDRCSKTFNSQREYTDHRSFPDGECADHKKRNQSARSNYIDLDQPRQTENAVLGYHDRPDSPDDMSTDDEWCPDCTTVFKSKAKYNAHALRCSSQAKSNGQYANSSQAALVTPQSSEVHQATLSPVKQRQAVDEHVAVQKDSRSRAKTPQSSEAHQAALSSVQPSPTGLASFTCVVKGCGKLCRSEAGLKVHQADVHGIGGKALDLHGSQSFMLNQRVREQLKSEGLLRPPGGSPRTNGRGGRAAPTPPPMRALAPAPARMTPPAIPPVMSPAPVPVGQHMGGDAEIEQAKYVQGKILRLLIQSDILIHHNGNMTVCGINWTRIGVSRQHDAVKLFDDMCHLPKILQGEYLPSPTTFKDEYAVQYPVNDFQASPNRDLAKPGLGIVVLSCSKILLTDGRQEVVKIAAIDLVTGRILMNHLVCNDPHAHVANWRSLVTGLSGWHDMEGARQAGYKIFKGWPAVRSALWKFVDKETIIVGHNLRSDLDSLRMIHGRAVDVAKVVEKAAKGPLSKAQLSLDSLCRAYPNEQLKTDLKYGRDCLMNAFATRELGLWVIKNKELFEKDVKQKSLDYQRVMPKATTA